MRKLLLLLDYVRYYIYYLRVRCYRYSSAELIPKITLVRLSLHPSKVASTFAVSLFVVVVLLVVVFDSDDTIAFFFLPTDTVFGMTVVFLVDGIFFEEVESKRKFSRKSIDFLPVVVSPYRL